MKIAATARGVLLLSLFITACANHYGAKNKRVVSTGNQSVDESSASSSISPVKSLCYGSADCISSDRDESIVLGFWQAWAVQSGSQDQTNLEIREEGWTFHKFYYFNDPSDRAEMCEVIAHYSVLDLKTDLKPVEPSIESGTVLLKPETFFCALSCGEAICTSEILQFESQYRRFSVSESSEEQGSLRLEYNTITFQSK